MRLPAAASGRLACLSGSAALACTLAAGCGSATVAELPAPAGPDRAPAPTTQPIGAVMASSRDAVDRAATPRRSAELRGGQLQVVLEPRARALLLEDARSGKQLDEIPVGVGPTQVGCAANGPCFVTDTTGDALLVVRVAADGRSLRLSRRVYLAGAPYAIAVDRERRRLWVTLTGRNELVELGAHGRPHILRRHPTVQQPDGARVDPATGDVTVIGLHPPRLQLLPDPASADRP
jgi:hypothetical protein